MASGRFVQRYYDPIIGRFLSPDPVETNPNNGASFNRYWYGNNNPYKFVDPDGRESAMFQREEYRMAPINPEAGAAAIGLIADFTPGISDLKAGYEAYQNPTAANIFGAGVGVFPVIGDAVGKLIKGVDKVADAGKKVPHGNTADARPATLYAKYDKDGNFLKHGVTKHEDPTKRYTKKQIDGGRVDFVERGPRNEILKKERDRVERNPGPDNKERWAGTRKE